MFYLQCCDCRVLCIVQIAGVRLAPFMPQNAYYFKPLGVLELLNICAEFSFVAWWKSSLGLQLSWLHTLRTCWSVELCLSNVALQYWAGMYDCNIMLQVSAVKEQRKIK